MFTYVDTTPPERKSYALAKEAIKPHE